MVCDIDADSSIPAPKFQLAGRIPDWRLNIPTGGSKPSSKARHSAVSSIRESAISSSAPSSKLTRGTTISSSSAPLTSISSNFDAGADKLTGLAISTLFDDDDLDESVECSQALCRMSKLKATQVTSSI